MKIEQLKKSLEFAKEFLSKEEYAATLAAIDLAELAIDMNDHIIQSDDQNIADKFQDKADAFLYFLSDED